MHQLKSLKISRIATVDKPDNPPAEIMLFKRKDNNMAEKTVTAEDLSKLPDHLQKFIEDLTTKAEKAKDVDRKDSLLAKALRVLKGEPDKDETEPLVKDADPEVTKAFDTLQKQLADTEKARKASDDRVAKLEAQREKDQMIALAKDLPGNPDDTASELVKIKVALGDEAFTEYVKRQKGVTEQLKVNKLFTQFGSDADSDAGLEGVEAQIDKAVDAIMTKSAELSKEQAEARFYETTKGQELWGRYQEALEQRQREVS